MWVAVRPQDRGPGAAGRPTSTIVWPAALCPSHGTTAPSQRAGWANGASALAGRKDVEGLNQHRRVRTALLTNEEKRARVEAELKADQARSDRSIAEVVGVDHRFVGRTRKRVGQTGWC